MVGVVCVTLLGIYLFYPAYSTATEKSLGGWTFAACNSQNGFLHGRLVPLIFPWLLWWAWRGKKDVVVKPSYWGLVGIVVGLVLFWASMPMVQPRWALFGVPFLLLGLGQYLFGWKVVRGLVFPAFFWWFVIPVPELEALFVGNVISWLVSSTHHVGLFFGLDLVREGGTVILGDRTLLIGGL